MAAGKRVTVIDGGHEREHLSGSADSIALAGIAYVLFDGLSHGRFDVQLPVVGSLTAAVLVVCLGLAFAAGLSDTPRFSALRGPFAPVGVAFVAYVFASATLLGSGFDLGFAKNLMLMLAILTFARTSGAVRMLFVTAAVAGVVQAGFGIAQYASVGMPQGGLTGFLPNHVQFGLYLSVSALAACALALEAKRPAVRIAWWAIVGLQAAVVVGSLARGVIVALAVAGVMTAFAVVRRKRLALVFAGGVGVALAGVGAVSGRFAQLARIPQALGDLKALDQLLNTRLQFILAAWNMFLARPLLGFGYGRYPEVWFEYAPEEILNPWTVGVAFAAHSTYLQIMAELGVVGIALYLAAIAIPIAALRRTLVSAEATDWAAAAVLCAVFLFAFHGILDNSGWHDRVFWALLALGVALEGRRGSEGPRVGYTTARKPQVPLA